MPIANPDRLWNDIQANPQKYEQAGKRARERALQKIRELVEEESTLILDCETTGAVEAYEEVVELAILKIDGTVLFHSLVSCKMRIHPDATKTHGITPAMLTNAPSFPEIWKTVSSLLEGKHVVIYNANFDVRILEGEAEHYGLPLPTYYPHCLMRMYMAVVVEGKYQLASACGHFGVEVPPHRGTEDAEATRQLLLKMASA
jgi:DNA polymerase III epsilon subunit family exonuclease